MSYIDINRLIELRKTRGWGQRQLAKEANISHTIISRLEAGTQTDVKLSVIIAIAGALNVTVDSLLSGGSLQSVESDLTPELQSVIRQIKRQSELVQHQAAGILRGFLDALK